METCDGTPGANLTLGAIYHQLMELDSIERALKDQIDFIKLQSRIAKLVVSTTEAESQWIEPDHWPGDSFEKIVHGLEQARSRVAGLHSSMREVANASSRSRIRPLNILDLPDELLRIIFEQCRNKWVSNENYFFILDPGCWVGVKDIKNIRLTCRRFCNTSSHLLLRHIDISMRPSSLAHLEEVARHPLLSKGIQAVRVQLSYFSADLATDIFHFTILAIMSLENTLDTYTIVFHRDSDQPPWNIPREKLGPALEKAELVLEEWSKFLNVLRDSQGDPDIVKEEIAKSRKVAGLVSAHEIYRQQYLAQESVLKDGAFVRAIATAMSKMPTANRLFVEDDSFGDSEDHQRKYVKPFVDAVEDPEGLAACGTVMPMTWDTARSKQLDDQPKEILLQLLITVFNNDIPINYLRIDLSPATDLSIPATQEQLQQLAAGTEHLRVLEFQMSKKSGEPTVDHGPDQIASFGSLISACMGGKALTRLDVDLSFSLDESAPQPPVSMGSLLVSRHSPELGILRLSHVPLHLSELKIFLEGLNGPVFIVLKCVLLLSGTWAEALDLLRNKARWESYVTRPRGAECDDMTEEEILAIFGKDDFDSFVKEGKANSYIRGSIKDNPLRIPGRTSAS